MNPGRSSNEDRVYFISTRHPQISLQFEFARSTTHDLSIIRCVLRIFGLRSFFEQIKKQLLTKNLVYNLSSFYVKYNYPASYPYTLQNTNSACWHIDWESMQFSEGVAWEMINRVYNEVFWQFTYHRFQERSAQNPHVDKSGFALQSKSILAK